MPQEKQGEGEMPEEVTQVEGESPTAETTDTQPIDAAALQAELTKAQAHIKELNAESASRRKALEAYEVKERKTKEAELSEAEKYKAQAAELQERAAAFEARIQDMAMAHAFQLAASKAECVDPDAALKLADLSGVEFDDDGKPDGEAIEKAIAALKKAKPYLFQQAPAGTINAADGRGAGRAAVSQAARDAEIKAKYNIRR